MNLVDLNLDMMNLVKDIPEDCAVFYFLVGEDEDTDFLFAKGNHELMSEALCHLMEENADIEWIVRDAIIQFQS
jgi:hypothetical protein